MTDLLMTPRCLLLATGRALVVCRWPLLRTLTGPASCTQHKLLVTSRTDRLVAAIIGSGDLRLRNHAIHATQAPGQPTSSDGLPPTEVTGSKLSESLP